MNSGDAIVFLFGQYSSYESLEEKQESTFYFCKDTGQLFLGTQLLTTTIDGTLTISGDAADAKITGDKLKELFESLQKIISLPAVTSEDNMSYLQVTDGTWKTTKLINNDSSTLRCRAINIVNTADEIVDLPEGCISAVLE